MFNGMDIKHIANSNPFFSICIPQYNRTAFLIEACKVLASQTFTNFEVCISDDQSDDGKEQDLIDYLEKSGLSFVYRKQEKNLRYDGNIRGAIALAQGKYCLLHGNDDCLVSDSTLQDLYEQIIRYQNPAVIVTNFEDWETGTLHQRIRETQLVGSGPEVAVTHFRNVAFVTGVTVEREATRRYVTKKWDGSEMYQMYIIARSIANGGSLLQLSESYIRKDIKITGESVDSYVRPRLDPCPIVERKLPMRKIGPLIADAVEPFVSGRERNRLNELVFKQLYLFTYPFWLFEYRRVQSRRYALGIALGLRPKYTFLQVDLSAFSKIKLYLFYVMFLGVGLLIPLNIYRLLGAKWYKKAKKPFLQVKKESV